MTLGWGQRSYIIKFRLPCQFQRFLYQTLCVFSQMKNTKHIRRDFHYVACVMPQGWDFGVLEVPGGGGGSKKIQTWSCGISNRWRWRAEQNDSNIFILGSNWWPWGEVNGQLSLTCQFQRFLYQLFRQMAENGFAPPPPPLENFADISYLVEI